MRVRVRVEGEGEGENEVAGADVAGVAGSHTRRALPSRVASTSSRKPSLISPPSRQASSNMCRLPPCTRLASHALSSLRGCADVEEV